MANFARTVWNNHFNLPDLPPPETFKGQSILITGASGGLGLATAVHFVNLGAASVIITARTKEKGEAAKASIERQTKTEGKEIVRFIELDMSTFTGTKQFADKVKAEVHTIDYALLNAGLMNTKFVLGKEGFEETLEINVLATALLALLLLPWIKEAGKGKAHLGFVTSGMLRGVRIDDEKFPQENVFEFFKNKDIYLKSRDMYAVSKLLEQYVMMEVAKLALGPDGSPEVIVNGMCPGMVYSDLGRQFKTGIAMSSAVNTFMTLVAKPTEGGARTFVLAALTTPEENGKYITHYQNDEDYKSATQKNIFGPKGKEMQAKVWEEILAILIERVSEVNETVVAARS